VAIAPGAEANWFPDFGNQSPAATTTYQNWIVEIQEREFVVGTWLTIAGEEVVSIRGQWVS
jgi:hypothetical protein